MRARLAGCALLAGLAASSAGLAQTLQQSPITPGFWTWPREKLNTPEMIAESCRAKVAIQFPDGRYFGVRLGDGAQAQLPPFVDEVGTCRFNPQSQTERCELRVIRKDGSVATGVIESKFATEADGRLKMSVQPTTAPGSPAGAGGFDVYPVKCPDDVIWKTLNGQ